MISKWELFCPKGLWNIAKQTVWKGIKIFRGGWGPTDEQRLWNNLKLEGKKTPFQALEAVGESSPSSEEEYNMPLRGGQATVQSPPPRAWRKTSLPLLFLFTVPTLRRPRLAHSGRRRTDAPWREGREAQSLLLALHPQPTRPFQHGQKSGMRGSKFLWRGVLNCKSLVDGITVQWLKWDNSCDKVTEGIVFIWEWLVHKIHSKRDKEMGYGASLKRRGGEKESLNLEVNTFSVPGQSDFTVSQDFTAVHCRPCALCACCREEATPTPCWNCFFDFAFCCFCYYYHA